MPRLRQEITPRDANFHTIVHVPADIDNGIVLGQQWRVIPAISRWTLELSSRTWIISGGEREEDEREFAFSFDNSFAASRSDAKREQLIR
jgi:hypothetical protein